MGRQPVLPSERRGRASRQAGAIRGRRHSDAELLRDAREGDTDAFAVLWQRHAASGLAFARRIAPASDAEDLVAEAFTNILSIVQRGGGPDTAFRPYLIASIRNVGILREKKQLPEVLTEDFDVFVDPATDGADAAAAERQLTVDAFTSLPRRWQEALWYREVERLDNSAIGELLGIRANAVAALTFRAKDGLRAAWIQAQLAAAPKNPECRWAIEHLGGHARNGIAGKNRRRIENHLHGCAACADVAREAGSLATALPAILGPLVVGGAVLASQMYPAAQANALAATGIGAIESGASAPGGSATAYRSAWSRFTASNSSYIAMALLAAVTVTTVIVGNVPGTVPPSAAKADVAREAGGSQGTNPDGQEDPVTQPPDATSTPTPTADAGLKAPSILSPAHGATIAGAVTASGTATAGNEIVLLVDGTKQTLAANSDGKWSSALGQLAQGSHTLVAYQTDPKSENRSPEASVTFKVGTSDSRTESLTLALDKDPAGLVFPRASGTAAPGNTVQLIDGNGRVLAATKANSSGVWGSVLIDMVGFGSHQISARQVDGSGRVSAPTKAASYSLSSISIAAQYEWYAAPPQPPLTATGAASKTFELLVDGAVVGRYTLGGSGTWNGKAPAAFSDGQHTLAVRYVGSDGRRGPLSSVDITVAS